MIARYTLPEMGEIWSPQNKFQKLLDVEVAVAEIQSQLKLIPSEAAQDIKAKGRFDVKRILEIEKTTKHDVIAFVSNVAENVGPNGRYVHYGLTSSDVIDTGLSLQIREAAKLLDHKLEGLEKALGGLAQEHAEALCSGRTHGMHAEPTSFGVKMAGFLSELQRNRARVKAASEQAARIKLSGAVGTYSALDPEVEENVGKKLGLKIETVATQVIPRDRHAEVLFALTCLASGFERLAVELRHLQRTEVSEVEEGFTKGQKGSSAMPHKKNPITSENLTGISRLMRGYLAAAMENIALWHERDISHSAVERVIFPDGFILCDYAAFRLTELLNNLVVHKAQMKKNMDLSGGKLFSSHVLLKLVQKGLSREEAYALVQKCAHENASLRSGLENDAKTKSLLSAKEMDEIFSGQSYLKNFKKIIERVLR